jgi:subtilisin family serine protease
MRSMLFVATFMIANAAAADKARAPERLVPGDVIVKFRADSKDVDTNVRALSNGSGVAMKLERSLPLGWVLLRATTPVSEAETSALIERARKHPLVADVSANGWKRIQAIPNDPVFAQMWHLAAIDAPAAWDITTGVSSQRIGIIDTGLLRIHEDVGSRAVDGFDFVSDLFSANDGDGADSDYNDPGDDCGGGDSWHGTHVAGTIGASTNNGTGIAGLNWQAGLVIGRALGRCGGNTADIMNALAWMGGLDVGLPNIGSNKVSVVNMSLGSSELCSSFEQDIINQVSAAGVVVVAATGNDGAPVGSPANCNGVLSVAASNISNDLAAYSNFGPEVEIVAPGGEIVQTQETGVLSALGPSSNAYAFYEGTSMACPHVAGVVSLMQARNPTISMSQIVSTLQTTGRSCNNCQGVPLMNAAAAVAAVDGTPVTPPTDDGFEDNDNASAASSLGCGSTLDLYALDEDWFRIGATGAVTINANGGAEDIDLYMFPVDNNNPIAQSTGSTGVESMQTNVGAGQYLIAVVPFETAQGPYQLQVTCTGIDDESSTPTDPVDPVDPTDPNPNPNPTNPGGPRGEDDLLEDNDSLATAAYVGCRSQRNLQQLDDDWFAFDPRLGERVRVATSAGVVRVEQGGVVLSEGSAEVIIDTAGAGDIMVLVNGVDGDDKTYDLTIECGSLALPLVAGGCSSMGHGVPMWVMTLAWLTRRRRSEKRQHPLLQRR